MALKFLSKLKKREEKKAPSTNFERELQLLKEDEGASSFTYKYASVTPAQLKELSDEIRQSKKLTHLALIGCRMNNPSMLGDLVKALKRSKSVTSIDFSDNEFGDEGVRMIAEVVQLRSNITTVSLGNCGITPVGCEALQLMLQYNKKIKALDLNQNDNLGVRGVKAICQGLLDRPFDEPSQIEELDLSECQIEDTSCNIIGSLLASCDNLVKLSVADNNITGLGGKALSHGLLKKTSGRPGLELLNLSGNRLGDVGISSLAQKLNQSRTIKTFLCNEVSMTEKGITNLCHTLKQADCVEELGISGNFVTEGVSVIHKITDMCANTSVLKVLDISKIPLSADDVKHLGDFIGQTLHCTLTKLNIAQTGIDDEGAAEIALGLKKNVELEDINLTSNLFGSHGIKHFVRMFKRAKSLKVFRVTGQSRIGIDGENMLAAVLKYNKRLTIKGVSRELDYINDFSINGGCFKWDNNKEHIVGWSDDAWEVVKRGCGQVISTAIHNLSREQLVNFIENVVTVDRNVVGQTMFEHVIRHAEGPALDVVACFVRKCRVSLDSKCGSRTSASMAVEMNQSDDVSYRYIAAKCAKDPMVVQMAKNNRLFLGRYLRGEGPAIHQTHEISRFIAKDTMGEEKYKDKDVFVQIYENELDFEREWTSRDAMKATLSAAGPFALDDTLLKEIEVHEDDLCISFLANISDLRHTINNLGITAGYNLSETAKLAKRAAQCLGTINNLGRIHGDFRPRNFLYVAPKRLGTDPLGKAKKPVMLPEKWVVCDLSRSVPHDCVAQHRMDSAYLPPEVAKVYFHQDHGDKALPLASEQMDVWSFGVVLYQLLTGMHLFHVEQNTDRLYRKSERLELMNWINLDEKRAKLILHRANESVFANETSFKRMKEAAVDLVNWCLQGDPYNRPTFSDILSHPFFHYKTRVNYTDLDLLLGWYKKIGADKSVASHKNNRTHGHLINSGMDELTDVRKVFGLYFKKFGCKITDDGLDFKIDVSKRQKQCQKARSVIILLTKDVFFQKSTIQKLLWAKDSLETDNLLLVNVATSYGFCEEFDFNNFEQELESAEGEAKLKAIVKELTPVKKHLNLKNVKVPSGNQEKWLFEFVKKMFINDLLPLKNKVIPYRNNPFQTEAMMNEIIKRSGFVSASLLKEFSLEMNETELRTKPVAVEEEFKVEVLVLFNQYNDVLKDLEKKVNSIYDKNLATRVTMISAKDKKDIMKFFTLSEEKGLRVLEAEKQVLVLCVATDGFFDTFRDEIQLLDTAKGLVSVVPVRLDSFDVTQLSAREELLNLGLENKEVIDRLQQNHSYIPLPVSTEQLDLGYETSAALDLIKKESKKAIELTRENKDKTENEAYAQYTHTNFFEAVY